MSIGSRTQGWASSGVRSSWHDALPSALALSEALAVTLPVKLALSTPCSSDQWALNATFGRIDTEPDSSICPPASQLKFLAICWLSGSAAAFRAPCFPALVSPAVTSIEPCGTAASSVVGRVDATVLPPSTRVETTSPRKPYGVAAPTPVATIE